MKNKMTMFFYCSDIAQRISEICGISRRQIFNMKRACFRSKLIKKIHLLRRLGTKIFISFDFEVFFHKQLPQLSTWDMTRAGCKQLRDFSVMNKNTLCKWRRKLGFCVKQQKMLMLWLQSVTLLKTRLRHRYFLVNLKKFFSLQLYSKLESGTRVLQWVLQKSFRSTYFVDHLPTAASNVCIKMDKKRYWR